MPERSVGELGLEAERWLLPAGIEETLPQEAEEIERLRRLLLDLFSSWGYRLVIPPFIEYLESIEALVDSVVRQRLDKPLLRRIGCAVAGFFVPADRRVN